MSFPISSTAYTPPTPLTTSSSATASSINSLFTNVNGINQALATLTGRNVLTTDGNLTLNQNLDTTVMMANTASRTITLPSLSGQRVPILVQKTSENNLPIIVQRNTAGEFVDNPFSSKTSPVTTSFSLFLPGESYLFIPMGTIWRVVTLNCPVDSYYTTVYRDTTNQAIAGPTGSPAVPVSTTLIFNFTTTGSVTSIYSTSTGIFTPQIPGIYSVNSSLTYAVTSGSASMNTSIFRNNTENYEMWSMPLSGPFIINTGISHYTMNGTTDNLRMKCTPDGAGILVVRPTCLTSFRLISRI